MMICKRISALLLIAVSSISFNAAWCADSSGLNRGHSVQELLTVAAAAYSKKDTVKAKYLFEKVLELEAENADANFSLGCISEDWGDLQDAKTFYLRALKSKPNDYEISDALDLLNKKIQSKTTFQLPIKLSSDKLVHNMVMNATPVGLIFVEICKRSGVTAIIDKSVEGKKITAKYSDVLQSEVLASICSSCDLQVEPLTDSVVLIQAGAAEYKPYRENDLPLDLLVDESGMNIRAVPRPIAKAHFQPAAAPIEVHVPRRPDIVPPPPNIVPPPPITVPPPPNTPR